MDRYNILLNKKSDPKKGKIYRTKKASYDTALFEIEVPSEGEVYKCDIIETYERHDSYQGRKIEVHLKFTDLINNEYKKCVLNFKRDLIIIFRAIDGPEIKMRVDNYHIELDKKNPEKYIHTIEGLKLSRPRTDIGAAGGMVIPTGATGMPEPGYIDRSCSRRSEWVNMDTVLEDL